MDNVISWGLIIYQLGNLAVSVSLGLIIYIATEKIVKNKKKGIIGYSCFVISISLFLIILGFPLIDYPTFTSPNQTDASIIGTKLDYGMFFVGFGFAGLTFASGLILNIISGYETDKKIDATYQYVTDKQKSAKKEEMEISCRLRILKKLTTRRR